MNGQGSNMSSQPLTFREIQQQRHEARANQVRRLAQEQAQLQQESKEQEERAYLEEQRLIREEEERIRLEQLRLAREADELFQREIEPLIALVNYTQNIVPIIQDARSPDEVIPYLREISTMVTNTYHPESLPQDNDEVRVLIDDLQTAVGAIIQALNTNERFTVRVGSYEMSTIQSLVGTIAGATGVEFELQAPLMDTTEDERLAMAMQANPELYFQDQMPAGVQGLEAFGMGGFGQPIAGVGAGASASSSSAPRVKSWSEKYGEVVPLPRRQASGFGQQVPAGFIKARQQREDRLRAEMEAELQQSRAQQMRAQQSRVQQSRAQQSRAQQQARPQQVSLASTPSTQLLADMDEILSRLQAQRSPTLQRLRTILDSLSDIKRRSEVDFAGYAMGADEEVDAVLSSVQDRIDSILEYIFELEGDFSVIQQGYYISTLDEIQQLVGR